MFRMLCRNSFISNRTRNVGVPQHNQLFLPRFVSNISKSTYAKAPIVDFLITKCGLSSERAMFVSKCDNRLTSNSIENLTSAFSLFEKNGFSQKQITKIISRCPSVLTMDPDTNLKLKFDYFSKLGFAGSDIAMLISSNPIILKLKPSNSDILDMNSIENPLRVISLLEKNGFTNIQVNIIISKCPSVLKLDPVTDLEPKIDYFQSLGICSFDLLKVITSEPRVLRFSLKDQIIPCVDFLKNLLFSDEDVQDIIKRKAIILKYDVKKIISPNIETLRAIGVSSFNILWLFKKSPMVFTGEIERLICIANDVKQMGFDPLCSSTLYVSAVDAMMSLSKHGWEEKLVTYRKFGFSKETIISMFRSQPKCMQMTEAKIRKGVHFFLNEVKWDSTYLAKYPAVLLLNLEKRIIPRYAVLKILISEGILRKNAMASEVFELTEEEFLEKFIIKYKTSVPQVEETYQDKIKIAAIPLPK